MMWPMDEETFFPNKDNVYEMRERDFIINFSNMQAVISTYWAEKNLQKTI